MPKPTSVDSETCAAISASTANAKQAAPNRRSPWFLSYPALTALLLLCAPRSAAASSDGAGPSDAPYAQWREDTVVLHVDDSIDWIGPGAYEAVIASVSAWQDAHPQLPTLVVERTHHGPVGYAGYGPAYNVLRYEPQGAAVAKGALAVTVASSDGASGTLLDADIVFNGQHRFGVLEPGSLADRHTAYDFQNVLTHELGHFLGIADENTLDPDATMYKTSARGETHKRDLEAADVASIQDLYQGERGESEPGACGGASLARTPKQGARYCWPALLILGYLTLRRRVRRAPNS